MEPSGAMSPVIPGVESHDVYLTGWFDADGREQIGPATRSPPSLIRRWRIGQLAERIKRHDVAPRSIWRSRALEGGRRQTADLQRGSAAPSTADGKGG